MTIASKYQILQHDRGIQKKTAQQKVQHAFVDDSDEELILYTKREVADLLKVKLSTISAWITQERIEPTKIGACTRISHAEVKRLIRRMNRRNPFARLSVEEQDHLDKVSARGRAGLERLEANPSLWR